jgi:hypothetical protein
MSEPVKIKMSDEDLHMIAAFVKSPVFGAFKRLISQHTAQCQGLLLHSDEHLAIIRLQGRVQGLQTLETLPALVVHQQEQRQKKAEQERAGQNEILQKKREEHESYLKAMEAKRIETSAVARG